MFFLIFLLRKESKNVVSVGNVAQSEKAHRKDSEEVSQKGYTNYTSYISLQRRAGYPSNIAR